MDSFLRNWLTSLIELLFFFAVLSMHFRLFFLFVFTEQTTYNGQNEQNDPDDQNQNADNNSNIISVYFETGLIIRI